jgi:hypothetical protein
MVLPPDLPDIEDIISHFFGVPPPDNKQGVNWGISSELFLERLKFIDKVPTWPAILIS